MPSDDREAPVQRLHPASLLFAFGRTARVIAVPAVLFLLSVDRSSSGPAARWGYGFGPDNFEWLLLFLVPGLVVAVAKYLSFRLRYESSELVIRSGILFRNERHVPYTRIQNLDARQNLLHRALGVVEVRVETGGGTEPEATISVLHASALAEMRRRVFEDRTKTTASVQAGAAEDGSAPAAVATAPAEPQTLLHLPIRELLLCGFIENRGLVIVGAVYGVLWEVGLLDRFWGIVFDDDADAPGIVRSILGIARSGTLPAPGYLLMALGGIVGLLVLVRVLSMAWAMIRLYDFRLTRVGDDLRTQFGLFTREMTTIPIRRVQTLTIREGPLHRLTGRVSVRAETAGGGVVQGGHGQGGSREREWLAPILRSAALAPLLQQVIPELDLQAVAWQPVHARAFRRALKPALLRALVLPALLAWPFGWWALPVLVMTASFAVVWSRHHVRHLGWASTDQVVMFRSGWWWRQTTVARVAKIQAVTLVENPFDRRAAMAQVQVDTAGASERSHRVRIPYLGRDVAHDLRVRLAVQAASTAFRW